MARRLALVALLGSLVLPSFAHGSDVIVQGTTDVRDAGLLDDVIIPGFQKAYPQYNLKFIAVGTGQALTNAEAGQGDAVLTHAPTSEKQFVDAGYSAGPTGRAVFFSDYVIIGPKDDPAGVFSGAAHNAAQAFSLIAAAGDAGKANFVSRGDNSGTNVVEKIIWKLTSVPLNSNGEPGSSSSSNPPWYHKANTGQGPTVQVANQCPFGGGGCYDITDRGTFNRLVASGAISSLKVVSDKNDASAAGGVNLLVNDFHAYAVNPRKVSSVNLAGAKAFLDFLTSPAFQAKLASYPNTKQPAFFADARPTLKLDAPLPRTTVAGRKLKITGTLTGNLPGYPLIDGAALTLQTSHAAAILKAAVLGPPTANVLAVRSVKQGKFTFVIPAARGGAYQISFPGSRDLSSSTYSLGRVTVVAKVTLSKARAGKRSVRLSGRALPGVQRDSAASLVALGRRAGHKHFHALKTFGAPNHRSRFLLKLKLGSGRWQLRVQYRDRTTVRPGTSRALSVSVR
jgi:tungstate transport system substrate-binding protein